MFAALMYASKVIMEAFPNIHLLGMLTMTLAVVYRKKALIPIYLYVFIQGLFSGFSPWWVPYLYIWTLLWGITVLLPKNMHPAVAIPVYSVVCGMHGFLFGILYSPAQALMYGLSVPEWISWIAVGIPYDMIHGISNLVMGTLVFPLSRLIIKLEEKI